MERFADGFLTFPTELRVRESRQRVITGCYDNADDLCRDAAELSSRPDVESVYVLANPIKRDLLARSYNKLTPYAKVTTSDDGIEFRVALFGDFDTDQPKGVMATEAERELARAVAFRVRDDLTPILGPPVVVSSGNGVQLLWRIRLPNTPATTSLITRFLKAMKARYEVAGQAKIDTSVSNAARLIKMPGTWVRKGDDAPQFGRPHRLSQLLDMPGELKLVTEADIEAAIAFMGGDGQAKTPAEKPKATLGDFDETKDWIDELFADGDVTLAHDSEYQGGWKWVCDCPLCDNDDRSGCLILNQDGWLNYVCQHANSCQFNKQTTEPKDRINAFLEALGGEDAVEAWKAKTTPRTNTEVVSVDEANALFGYVAEDHAAPVATPAATPAAAAPANVGGDGRPVIVVNGTELHHKVDRAVAAIVAWGGDVYAGPEGLSVIHDGQIRRLSEPEVLNLMSRSALWVKRGRNDRTTIEDPPEKVAKVIHKRVDLPLPQLHRVVTTPYFAADGRLIAKAGYDPAGVYLVDSQFLRELPAVPEKPTKAQVTAARDWLTTELLGDFPFESEADKANCVGLMVLPFVREMVAGATPLHLIEAPQASTGKGKIADCFAIISTGEHARVSQLGDNEEETRKLVTTLLKSGASYADFDNVTRINSLALEKALTTDNWTDRLMATNDAGTYPVRLTWLATGNNVKIGRRDMARRVVRVRIDAGCQNPHLRDPGNFRHPNLLGWATKNRAKLVHACLTLAKAWIVAGQPGPPNSVPQRGSYEAWREVVGGILAVAGVPGFLGSDADSLAEMDEDQFEWGCFVDAWSKAPGGAEYHRTASSLLDLANQRNLLEGIRTEKNPGRVMGYALNARRGQVFGPWVIRTDKSKVLNAKVYFLERVGPEATPEPVTPAPVPVADPVVEVAAAELPDWLADDPNTPPEVKAMFGSGAYVARDGKFELKNPVDTRSPRFKRLGA